MEQTGIGTFRGVPVVEVTCRRIRQSEEQEGLHYYRIRHTDDDWGQPWSVEKYVLVNHYGTVVTSEPIPYLEETPSESEGKRYIELTEDEIQFIFENE